MTHPTYAPAFESVRISETYTYQIWVFIDCFFLDLNTSKLKVIFEDSSQIFGIVTSHVKKKVCNYSHYSGMPTAIMGSLISVAYFRIYPILAFQVQLGSRSGWKVLFIAPVNAKGC